MKRNNKSVFAFLLAVALLTVPLSGGCMTEKQSLVGDAESGGTSGETATETERIAALERQLEALREEQALKNGAYEARIRELERAVRIRRTNLVGRVDIYIRGERAGLDTDGMERERRDFGHSAGN